MTHKEASEIKPHPINYVGIVNGNSTCTIDNMDKLVDEVSKYYGIDKYNLFTKSRYRKFVLARQIIFVIAREKLRLSCIYVARYFNKDHTTVIHGTRTIHNLIQYDNTIKRDLEKIKAITKQFEYETNQY